MNFKDALNSDINKHEITLGYNDSGNLIIDIKKYPSIIITGETGTGKSIMLDQILLQLINKYSSLDLCLIPIDTSGVELNYYADTKYTLMSALNNENKAYVVLSRVLREIDRRKALLKANHMISVDNYNMKATKKLPLLVVAIDDDKSFLSKPDIEKMLKSVLTEISNLNIFFVLSTSDTHNKFFKKDINLNSSISITFDYGSQQDAENINIFNSENLHIGEFYLKYDDVCDIYHNYDFDDSIIKEIL